MKKTIVIVLVLAVVAAAGAFADFSLGLTGALYMDDGEYTARTVGDAFRAGEGIYYGIMGEFMGEHWGLGANLVTSVYTSSFDAVLMDADINAYLVGHIMGSRKFLDPMVEIGLGYISKDYADSSQDDDPENPIAASTYWFIGAGLGVNLGPVGFYTKFDYHAGVGTVTGNSGNFDEYDIEAFGLKPYKVTVGAKIMFPFFPRG